LEWQGGLRAVAPPALKSKGQSGCRLILNADNQDTAQLSTWLINMGKINRLCAYIWLCIIWKLEGILLQDITGTKKNWQLGKTVLPFAANDGWLCWEPMPVATARVELPGTEEQVLLLQPR